MIRLYYNREDLKSRFFSRWSYDL